MTVLAVHATFLHGAQVAAPAGQTTVQPTAERPPNFVERERPIELVMPGIPSNVAGSLELAKADIAKMQVREGFVVEAALPRIEGARFIEFAPDGRLFISRPRFEDIVVASDKDRDGVFETVRQYVGDVPTVHGLCWQVDAALPAGGTLWFSTGSTICQTRDLDNDGFAEGVIPVLTELPSAGMHWWRSILVTSEYIYTSVGDSENITDETTTDRQKIWRYSLTGSDKTLFASGVRNTEKLRYRPGTTELWGVDHGSDWFGQTFGEDETKGQPITDFNPPDELNHYEEGKFYGHPFITGYRVPRNEFRERDDLVALAARTQVPEWAFGAHWASNGFTFVDASPSNVALPADWAGDLIVASRGSWNRSERAGYQVGRVLFDKDPALGGKPYGYQTLVSTLGSERPIARPVDVAQAPSGEIFFSADQPMGRVYRLRWTGATKPPAADVPAEQPVGQPADVPKPVRE